MSFSDVNTRTARFLQYGSIWKDTNKFYDRNFEIPILYLSHCYKLYDKNYRENIRNVVVQKDFEVWNRWFQFNLNMIDEALYKFYSDLDVLPKRKWHSHLTSAIFSVIMTLQGINSLKKDNKEGYL